MAREWLTKWKCPPRERQLWGRALGREHVSQNPVADRGQHRLRVELEPRLHCLGIGYGHGHSLELRVDPEAGRDLSGAERMVAADADGPGNASEGALAIV